MIKNINLRFVFEYLIKTFEQVSEIWEKKTK